MKMIKCEKITDWDLVYTTALATERKSIFGKMPNDEWKMKMAHSPHSPIRALQFLIQFECPYFVQNHLVRHHEGVQWFVGSQRNDRQHDYDRNAARQDTPVMVTAIINAEALAFISRRRLCNKASAETRDTWRMIIDELRKVDQVVASCCVPECVYRGFCPEQKSCGYCDTEMFDDWIESYRNFKV